LTPQGCGGIVTRMEGLGGRIREARIAQGWATYLDIYNQTGGSEGGVPPKTWENWETDRSDPTASNLARLSVYLRVTTDWLLGLSEDGGPGGRARAMPSGGHPPFARMFEEAADSARRGSRSARRSNPKRRR
jgi:transcriptional regulator with XRE-family HTH domain